MYKTTIGGKALGIIGAKFYYTVPDDVNNIKTAYYFKQEYKKHLLESVKVLLVRSYHELLVTDEMSRKM